MRSLRAGLLALICGIPVLLGGCAVVVAGAAAGVGTYVYIKGELQDTESVPLDRAWSATQAAVHELEFTVKESSKDSLEARLVAEQADKNEVTIKLHAEGDSTRFGIRVGIFGDEDRSRLIMDKIKARL